MEAETRHCQNCKNDFVIEPDDFGFYEKINVLPPRLCPDCLWSDDLDSKKYGQDYDPKRPFFEQFRELWEQVPKPALVSTRDVDCSYMNLTADNRNCYKLIESSNNENCINCYWIQLSKDLVDCFFTNKVEFSYEVDDCYDCHSISYSKSCYNCLDSAFLLDCRGCTSCLGCINLRGQKYNIFNKQYSKDEYEEKLKSYKLDKHSGIEAFKKEFAHFIKDKPRKFAEITNAVNSTGNYMTNVKNNRHCFHSYEAEDNAYSNHVWRGAKDCMDCNTAGRTAERLYNTLNTGMEASNIICGLM